MTRSLTSLAALTTAAALAACAPFTDRAQTSVDRTPRQCFFASNVNSFRPIEGERRDALAVRVGARDEFELEPVGICQDIRWAQGIVLRPSLGSGNSLCVGDIADVISRGGGSLERCQVRVIRQIPRETQDR